MEAPSPKNDHGFRCLASFVGQLTIQSNDFNIRIDITDWDFVDYPMIHLLDQPESFRPHVDQRGGLCYLTEGSCVFDRNFPVENVKRCLGLASDELERQLFPGYIQDESRYEFVRYWSENGLYLLGTVQPEQGIHKTNATFINSNTLKLLSDCPEETQKIKNAIAQKQLSSDVSFPAWVITLRNAPWLNQNGSPKTWHDVWLWLKMVDESAFQRLIQVVNSRDFEEAILGAIVFRYGQKWFGFDTQVPDRIRKIKKRIKFHRRGYPKLAPYLRTGDGAGAKINTFSAYDITESFIYRRNLSTMLGLGKLKVHQVGVGAIGSYLAQQLIRLGAGAEGGEFRVIDPQILVPENLGRHTLGFDFLFKNKAKAMETFLNRQFPTAAIYGVDNDARHVDNLFDCDLLIDATGEEALSLVLNERHQEIIKSGNGSPAMIFAWVLANGEVVQALLSDGGDHACYDCLYLPDGNEIERQRFRILEKLPETRQIGCHSMRPYATTAPATAAALTAQMAVDWRTGNQSPRFRTIYLGHGPHINSSTTDSDPDRLPECCTCSKI